MAESHTQSDGGDSSGRYNQREQAFAELVFVTLEDRGLPEVAEWARENHRDGRSLGPVEVAREEGITPNVPEMGSDDPFAASKVADAIEGGYDDHQSGVAA